VRGSATECRDRIAPDAGAKTIQCACPLLTASCDPRSSSTQCGMSALESDSAESQEHRKVRVNVTSIIEGKVNSEVGLSGQRECRGGPRRVRHCGDDAQSRSSDTGEQLLQKPVRIYRGRAGDTWPTIERHPACHEVGSARLSRSATRKLLHSISPRVRLSRPYPALERIKSQRSRVSVVTDGPLGSFSECVGEGGPKSRRGVPRPHDGLVERVSLMTGESPVQPSRSCRPRNALEKDRRAKIAPYVRPWEQLAQPSLTFMALR